MSTGTISDTRLIERWIDPAREYPGDPEARIAGSGVHVWALVGHLRGAGWDPALTAADYELPVEAAQAALAYYHRHREVIDARLAANHALEL